MRHIFSATQLQNKDKRASMFSSKVSMQTLYEFFNAHVWLKIRAASLSSLARVAGSPALSIKFHGAGCRRAGRHYAGTKPP
jgi:hypothetical protein